MNNTELHVLCKCPTCGAASSIEKELFEDVAGALVARGVCMACGELVSFVYVPAKYASMATAKRLNGKLSSRKPHYS